MRVVFGTKPLDLTVPFYDEGRTTPPRRDPALLRHPPAVEGGNRGYRSARAAPATARRAGDDRGRELSLHEVNWAGASFEGRVLPSYKSSPVRERRTFPAGSIVVPVAQPAALVAVHLLEPSAPDSLVAWGFFNAIFEQKEYGEDYVMEKLAREMLAKDET